MKKLLFFLLVIGVIAIVAVIVFSAPPAVEYKQKESPKKELETSPVVVEEKKQHQPVTTNPTPKAEKVEIKKTTDKKQEISAEKTKEKARLFNAYFVNSDNVRIREKPFLNSPIIGSLKIGQRITITKANVAGDPVANYKSSTWNEVGYWKGTKFVKGYMYGAFVTHQQSSKFISFAHIIETEKQTFIREGPSTFFKTIAELPPKTKVLALLRTSKKGLNGKTSLWFKIAHGKGEGWVPGSSITIDQISQKNIPISDLD